MPFDLLGLLATQFEEVLQESHTHKDQCSKDAEDIGESTRSNYFEKFFRHRLIDLVLPRGVAVLESDGVGEVCEGNLLLSLTA